MAASPALNDLGKIALIGIGLIGSSIARAIKAAGLPAQVAIWSRSAETRRQAAELGFADTVCNSLDEAVRDADLVILCTPVGTYAALAAAMSPILKPGAIVSDVGSVKAQVLADLQANLPAHARLIPAHPVAGTENSGPASGFAGLFKGRWCILTPPPGHDPAALSVVEALWQAMGARTDIMDARHHDMVLAVTSHIPHLIAYTIVGTASDIEAVTESEVIKYSAGGFRDFTRIAASDPTMWRDIFLSNSEAVLDVLQRFSEDLTALQRAIRWKDGDTLFELFSRTRAIRREIIDAEQDTARPDFGRAHEDQ